MTSAWRKELLLRFAESVTVDVPLARLTTYRIGGPVSALVDPHSAKQVAEVMRLVRDLDVPCMTLGLGSNVLASDEGFNGVVIRLGKGLASIDRGEPEECEWTVGAGVPIPLLARQTAKAGMAGVHRLIGVPGTVGGGVFMNAGAHGQEFQDVVSWVDVVGDDCRIGRITGEDVTWRYRDSGLKGTVTAAGLRLTAAPAEHLLHEIKTHLEWRKAGTPFEQPCCGSVFRNPDADLPLGGITNFSGRPTAGRLIDSAGMKGFRVGGAEVSSKHANYIVNLGGAKAGDVKKVIDAVHGRVMTTFGVELELEVEILNDG